MSKADRLKEDLAWLKLFFGAFLAVDVSVIAWLVQNYRQAEMAIVVGAFIIITVLTVGLVFVTRRAYKRIEQLEEC
jgi:NADH:ubiquinone oxidoreductase subunit 3 (subunit A)